MYDVLNVKQNDMLFQSVYNNQREAIKLDDISYKVLNKASSSFSLSSFL
jgi:hypothetical protein